MNNNPGPDDIDGLLDKLGTGEISVNDVRKAHGLPPLAFPAPAPPRPTLASRVVTWTMTVGLVAIVLIGVVAFAKLVLW